MQVFKRLTAAGLSLLLLFMPYTSLAKQADALPPIQDEAYFPRPLLKVDVTKIIPRRENPSTIAQVVDPENKSLREFTKAEITMVAALVTLEARGESDEGQMAVAQVVLNRLYSGRHGKTLKQVVYRKRGKYYDFTPAKRIAKTKPTEKALKNTMAVLCEGERVLHDYVYYFKARGYHKGRYFSPYKRIGNHYFSYDKRDA